MLNSLTKLECLVCQTGLSGFGSSNFTTSFIKFQNHLFTPPSRRHQETFNYPLDHVTPEGVKELGEGVNRFIL
jgi:hypothetical protein